LHTLINNVKIVGVFLTICLISLPIITPIWNNLEYKGNIYLTGVSTFLYTIIITSLYFIAGRFFIKSSGSLFYDGLSFVAIIIIYAVILMAPQGNFTNIAYNPFLLFITLFKNQATLGMVISSLISIAAVYIGIIKNSV
jgi:hypothetical protein